MVRIRVTLADIRDVEKDTAVNDDKEADNRTVDGEKNEDEIVADVETDTAVNDDKEAEKRTIDGEKDEDEITLAAETSGI